MAIYTATFSAVAVSAAQDLFEITAPSNSQVVIRELRLGQYSDFGDAQAEILSVLIMRGHTTTGSGGSTVTPSNLSPKATALSASSTVKANNTTVATNGSPQTMIADTWNEQFPFLHLPRREECIVLDNNARLVVRITAPADAITMNGTLMFEEIGQIPG